MTEAIQHDTADAIDFLRKWSPDDDWCLTAIIPDGKTETRTFKPSEAEDAADWIESHQGKRNLYFHVNQTRQAFDEKGREKKPGKGNVLRLTGLHVDIDPRAGEDIEQERARALALLQAFNPKPTAIIDSGGGFQGFWKLDPSDKLTIDGDVSKAQDLERYNIELEKLFQADHCHNCDRLMRLPGTINVPTAKKRKKGRKPAVTHLSGWTGSTHPLEAFTPIAATATGNASTASRNASPRAGLGEGAAIPSAVGVDELRAFAAANRATIKDDTLALIATGDASKWDGDRSKMVFTVVCDLVRAGVPDELIAGLLLDQNNVAFYGHMRDQKTDRRRYAQRQIERARGEVAKSGASTATLILHPDSPLESARLYIERHRPTLMHNNDDWLAHDGAAYVELEDKSVRAALYDFLDRALIPGKDDAPPRPFNPNKTKVSNVLDALQGVAHRPRDTFAPPCWLDGDGPPAHELVACRNGLLHLPTGTLHESTPRFFTRNALTFDYDASAPAPSRWLAFLESLWPSEPDAIATLQEVFGYVLIPDTSLQKIFMLVGPKRSGKGTVARVLTELVGRHNTCAPTLASLSDSFGLEPLIGKQLAIASDVRLGAKTDHAALAENLLRISGEDMVTASRKYKRAWDGKLAVRFLIMTNIMPKFADASGALANRFVPLVMSQSFFGRENPGLLAELLPELPGVLNWAIEGWRRLRERGHFELPTSSREAIQNLADLASPETAFLRDECELDPSETVPKPEVFRAWQDWCSSNNAFPGTMDVFSSRLQAAAGGRVAATKVRTNDGRRTPSFRGIRLRQSTKAKAQNRDGPPF